MRKITTIILLFITVNSFSWQINAQNPDIDILETINGNPNQVLKGYSTFMSESALFVSFGVPAALGAISLINHDDEMLKNALYIAAAQAAVKEKMGIL